LYEMEGLIVSEECDFVQAHSPIRCCERAA
jgi:hypothetical protein